MTYQITREQALAQRRWVLVDASGRVLGRLASEVARILRGKHKPTFAPHVDGGDFVVIVNASRVRLSGRKLENKEYYRHSEYPGGIRVTKAKELLANRPEELLRLAIKGMLPRNRLGRKLMTKVKIYAGPEHAHQAQQPKSIALGG
ncbi:MAG TPA: 50S ribosomal protein L13 [Candidatus Acidoferrales bacterium]|nr:50S ribosomal protein L13 [Candidatus Acidoferrales bacterium]